MWPFTKKSAPPPPEDVVVDGVRASYEPLIEMWSFDMEGLSFTYGGLALPVEIFDWARSAVEDFRILGDEIDHQVKNHLAGSHCNPKARELISVSLDDYPSDRHISFDYAGDDSWGDYSISVIVSDGEILGINSGD